jgi:glucuronyl/N-acetylglucosaminyl transferase EXT2
VILHHLTVTIQFRVVIFLFAFGLRFEYKLVLWVFAFLQVLYLYRRYFFSMATIVNTVLDIVNERVFPSAVHGYEHWNNPPYNPTLTDRLQFNYPLPLDLPAPPPTDGFTAVILAYDRIEMLFQVIKSVSKAPSLAKVLVVWNNVKKMPPPSEEWPRIKQRIQVIRSKENKLSNRFYPYPEIQTACILAVDDDITMISADELEFGYKVASSSNKFSCAIVLRAWCYVLLHHRHGRSSQTG